jgi:hypothetical protein
MSTPKDLTRLIQSLPDDSSPDEIVRELAFHVMIERGLADSDAKRTISNEEMGATHSILAEITWTNEALRWLEDIFEYIAADNPGHGTSSVAAAQRDRYMALVQHRGSQERRHAQW